MRPVCLLDPYGRDREGWIYAADVVDRAALAECRAAQWAKLLDPGLPGPPHGLRWQYGRPAACADHLQDAIAAAAQLELLGPGTAKPSRGPLDGLVCVR